MSYLKRQLIKKIVGFASLGVLFVAVVFGVALKRDNLKVDQKNHSTRGDYRSGNETMSGLGVEVEQPTLICSDLLEEDENFLVLREYSKAEVVDCMYVGCGGIY